MKRCSLAQTMIGLFMITLVAIMTPQQALAFTFNATNNTDRAISIAVVCFDDVAGLWECRGWSNIPAKSTRTFDFADSNRGKYVYTYVMSGDREWTGEGYDGSITRTVINKAFRYNSSGICPDGPNRRVVYFQKNEIYNGEFSMSWQW